MRSLAIVCVACPACLFGQTALVDFENVAGIPAPHNPLPGRYIPVRTQIPGIRFGPPGDPGLPAGPALLTFSSDPNAVAGGAFGPALSGNTALYVFPGRLVFPFPDAPDASARMVRGMGINFETPVNRVSSGILVSSNSSVAYSNMLFSYTLLDGTQNFIILPNATPGNWITFTFDAPTTNPLVFMNFSPILGDRTGSDRPFAIDDLTYTPIPSPTGAILVGLGGLAALRRRR